MLLRTAGFCALLLGTCWSGSWFAFSRADDPSFPLMAGPSEPCESASTELGRDVAGELLPVLSTGNQAGDKGEDCRVYVSKILGTTFATVATSAAHSGSGPPPAWGRSSSSTASLFTAALAGGLSIPRPSGSLRLECEGALRDNFSSDANQTAGPAIRIQAADNWTVLGNVWRDLPLTSRLSVYAGGGVGGGGYRLTATAPDGSTASSQPTLLAWQAGGGAMLHYNSLIDLDISYRFLEFAQATSALSQPGIGGIGSVSSTMTAGEIFLMLRVHEPFQWAKHLRSRQFYLPE